MELGPFPVRQKISKGVASATFGTILSVSWFYAGLCSYLLGAWLHRVRFRGECLESVT